MKRTARTLAITIAALAAVACGQTIEQKAATGAIAGAVVAGPVGAVVGGAASAAIGQADKPNGHSRPSSGRGGAPQRLATLILAPI